MIMREARHAHGSPMVEAVRTSGRYLREFRRFLREPLDLGQCPRLIQDRLRNREQNFLRSLETRVFSHAASPYRRLLEHAQITHADIERLVKDGGVEFALGRLRDAGVYVTYEEFKGRVPIIRPGLEFSIRQEDFDNVVTSGYYQVETAGSRGLRRRGHSLEVVAHDAAYQGVYLAAFDLTDRPIGVWNTVPPGTAGLHIVLYHVKLGKRVERWFSQNAFKWTQLTFALAIYGSRLFGASLPVPEHVPVSKPRRVATWLARKRKRGRPALLDTNASSAVRVCLAALEAGLDISGTFFRLGGEPFTPGKASVLAQAGSSAATHYSMSEVGRVGTACAAPHDLDDVHVATDKLAVIQREKCVGGDGPMVGVLLLTTLMPFAPKVMLNTETDDYAILEERVCGCPFQQIGLTTHLRGIRSYDKLTSEGMTFLGSRVLSLLEEILPARFGGHVTDYQFVEEEEGGLPKIHIIVDPKIGAVDEADLVKTVLTYLGSEHKMKKMGADRWREANTLRVVRRVPFITVTGKILPLHIPYKPS